MDAGDIALVVVSVLGTIAIVWAGFLLDRRSQRIRSAKWMQGWRILTRVRNELFQRWHGPLRLRDQRSAPPPPEKSKRKPATRRRKRSSDAQR